MNNDFEAFISYRHKECNALAKALHDELLNEYNINSFRDDECLHFGDFRRQLVKNNKKSNFLILLLTSETMKRCDRPGDWITKEVSLFLERGKPIIPVLLDGFELSGNVPEIIQDLEKHGERSIKCSISGPYEAARYIASAVKERLREGWSEKSVIECRDKKHYLSPENIERDGYYYTSANDLRKALTVFALYALVLIIATVAVFRSSNGALTVFEDNLAFIYLLSMLNGAVFFWQKFKTTDAQTGEKVSLLEYSMDGPVGDSTKKLLFSFFAGAIITLILNAAFSFLIYMASMMTAVTVFGKGDFSVAESNGWMLVMYVPCLLLPTLNALFRSLMALANYLNCLFARYPQKYKNWMLLKKLNVVRRVLSVIFSIVLPVILGAMLLIFTRAS